MFISLFFSSITVIDLEEQIQVVVLDSAQDTIITVVIIRRKLQLLLLFLNFNLEANCLQLPSTSLNYDWGKKMITQNDENRRWENHLFESQTITNTGFSTILFRLHRFKNQPEFQNDIALLEFKMKVVKNFLSSCKSSIFYKNSLLYMYLHVYKARYLITEIETLFQNELVWLELMWQPSEN